MWQAVEATIAISRRFLPSAERAAAQLLDESASLPAALKSKTAHGLPEFSLDAAAAERTMFAKAPRPVDMHVSQAPDLHLNLRDTDPGSYYKPRGLWTSDKLAWVPSQGTVSRHDVVRGFAYHVDTSKAQMMDVATPENLQNLIRRYGKANEFPSRREGPISLSNIDLSKIGRASEPEFEAFKHSDINWSAMARDFDGVRFSGYQNIKREVPVPHWFDGLDLSSSVTWNNVGKVQVTPLGKVPSYYEPAFQEKLKALITRASEIST